ncbi:MAG: hypothetical protein OEU90_02585 [Gammaproteobacteria bacterium]|jgi:hypothetical protein|nr:hypothetical protein [Gammaproteobacteria bacterium]MDH3751688.1 hypothetical protein [Gammaproteobacteria bacterium]MDH3804339.1 hypothetical protein [Gammaproteobacteria bacterium]
MDKLAKQLREDADQIACNISPELDERIRASLHGITPKPVDKPGPASRPAAFWWASSLTGVAAAVAIIAVVNLQAPEPGPEAANSGAVPLILPTIKWNTETAVLTSPLEQEIEDLQSDLKKAEEAVRQDIDRLF